MRTLFIIPARKGSKGIIGKNTINLFGKPLVSYSFDFVLKCKSKDDLICVSSNDESVIDIAKNHNIKVHFKRPENLATDFSSSYEFINHAISFYESKGEIFENICLLQPTSPIRNVSHFLEMKKKFVQESPDMIVSVKNVSENPYFTMYREEEGFLKKFINNTNFTRRQDLPKIYNYNGSIYLFNVKAFKKNLNFDFKKILKYVMTDEYSIDIDNEIDLVKAEYYLNKKKNLIQLKSHK